MIREGYFEKVYFEKCDGRRVFWESVMEKGFSGKCDGEG